MLMVAFWHISESNRKEGIFVNANKFLLIGEAMGLLIAQQECPLDEVTSWDCGVAGAELNVAIGLARLGHRVQYLTRVGDDTFGKKIERTLMENNIDASLVRRDSGHSTGFMLKGKVSHGDPPICYFRRNSAASSITAEDVEQLDLTDLYGGIFHITGIFPALSSTAHTSLLCLIEIARSKGMTISFDPNLRPSLWENESKMLETLNAIAEKADIILPGYQEGEILCKTSNPEKIADFYLNKGVKTVIVKLGDKGAYAATKSGGFYSAGFHAERVVDTVGAGDGFAAGVLSGIAEGLSLEDAVKRGNAIGTLQVMSVGDNSGLPNRDKLERFM